MKSVPSITALRCFDIVARNENLGTAADLLHLTPGAVSKQVKNLEEALGIELFAREKKNLVLNDEGKRFYLRLRSVLQGLDSLVIDFQKDKGQRQVQKLKLSVDPVFLSSWLVKNISEFIEAHPSINITIDSGLKSIGELKKFDLVINSSPQRAPGLSAEVLHRDYIVAFASKDFFRGQPQPKCVKDLLNYPILHHFNERNSYTSHWFQQSGVSLEELKAVSGHFFTDHQVVISAALNGLGIAVLPYLAIKEYLEEGSLILAVNQPEKVKASLFLFHELTRSHEYAISSFRQWTLEKKVLISQDFESSCRID